MIRWAGHVECMGNNQMRAGLWLENEKHGDHLEDLGVDGRIILQWILNK
jgi:hypothetical protein